jgi:hypothetical protein
MDSRPLRIISEVLSVLQPLPPCPLLLTYRCNAAIGARDQKMLIAHDNPAYRNQILIFFESQNVPEKYLCSKRNLLRNCSFLMSLGAAISSGKTPNAIQQHPRRPAIILIVVEDPLLHRAVLGLYPSKVPFNRRCHRWVCIAPTIAEVAGKRLD